MTNLIHGKHASCQQKSLTWVTFMTQKYLFRLIIAISLKMIVLNQSIVTGIA